MNKSAIYEQNEVRLETLNDKTPICIDCPDDLG